MTNESEFEFDWQTHRDPEPLIVRIVGPLPQGMELVYGWWRIEDNLQEYWPIIRRLRLYATHCVRQLWHMLTSETRNAVLLAEKFADSQATLDDLRAAALRCDPPAITHYQHAKYAAAHASAVSFMGSRSLTWCPAEAARRAASALACELAGPAPHVVGPEWHGAWRNGHAAARAFQADILRDIVPPPGAEIDFDPDWRTSTVVELARMMDATGDFSAVPILADALEEAGCMNGVILQQCRKDGPHVRGNWVVELILGTL